MRNILPAVIKRQHGIALIEVLIACSILAAVGIVFLFGLTTAYRTLTMNDRSTTMESLAKSALEDAKAQEYIGDDKCPIHQEYQYLGQPPTGYAVTITATCIDASGLETNEDTGLQLINVTVTHQSEQSTFQISGYKLKPKTD